MEVNVNDVVTLGLDEKYLVLTNAMYNDAEYYYLIGVTEDGENVKDNIKIVRKEKDNEDVFLIPIEDENEAKAVAAVLLENIKNNAEIA